VVEPAAPLLAPLRRIRRRLRWWRALDGAVAGLAVGLTVAALMTAFLHHRGHRVGASLAFFLAIAGGAAGAVVRAAGRISLVVCARQADAALDGHDRVLSALDFARTGRSVGAAALAQASIADAVVRLAELLPARAVPARRPRGFRALAAGALVAVLAGVSPVRSPAVASQMTASTRAAAVPLARGSLEAERETVRAIAREAAQRHDGRAAALAAELERTLGRLEAGALDGGAALDALRALGTQAAEAARAGERQRAAFDAAIEALANQSSTRAAAEALRAGGEAAGQKSADALGRGAETRRTETAGALAAAAHALAAAGAGQDETGKPGRRRLARDKAESPAAGSEKGGGQEESERRLERLSRDLDEAAGACRDGSPNCRSSAENRARDLAGLGQRAAGAEAMRRLERAAEQARARLGRGELREGEAGGAEGERQFQRAARGESDSAPGDGRQGRGGEQQNPLGNAEGATGARAAEASREGRGGATAPGESGRPEGTEAGEGAAANGQRSLVERAVGSAGSAATGGGVGHNAGGPPLGRATGPGSRGRETEARVADGAGPSRAEVIGVAAGRGFAAPTYARVFADYQSAVEEALGSTAVPEGKRYLVRRYFDLIRPRDGGGRR